MSSSSTPSSDKNSHKGSTNLNGMISLASKRRYIAPQQQLENYGAKRLASSSSPPPSPAAAAAVPPSVGDVSCSELVGISICGWDVTTSQGPIGDHLWFESTTDTLEQSAQYNDDNNNNDGDSNKNKSNDNNNNNGRKIVLPEMVFPHAHVFVGQRSHQSSYGNSSNNDNSDVGGGRNGQEEGQFITWDAVHALREWSEAHQQIPLPSHQKKKRQQQQQDDDDDDGDPMSSLTSSFRGVSVLQSNDAQLWKRKLRSGGAGSQTSPTSSSPSSSSSSSFPSSPSPSSSAAAIAAIENTTFHYDWTYSTPFVGSIATGRTIRNSSKNSNNDRSQEIAKDGPSSNGWCSLERSGMDMSLLTDQSVPILFYDQVDLYEDDLHDNGFIEYGVKVRVMPRCIYVLARLFLRVDNVLVRVRDARWLVDFQKQCIFRDVTWREAYWDRLGQLQLPTQVKSWTAPAERQQQQQNHQHQQPPQQQSGSSATAAGVAGAAGGGGGGGSGGRELHAFQSLLNKLPVVEPKDMPSDLPLHAVWNYKV